MPSPRVVFDRPKHPYPFSEFSPVQDPYKYSSPVARAIYWQGSLIPSSLYPLIEPEQSNFDLSNFVQFWAVAHTPTTTFWSQDLENLYNAISGEQWRTLCEDWDRLMKECERRIRLHNATRRDFLADDFEIWAAVSIRMEMREEHQTFIGELRIRPHQDGSTSHFSFLFPSFFH